MTEPDELVRKLAETRATLARMVERFGEAPSMQTPIERLRQQEARLLEDIKVLMSERRQG